VSDNKKTAKRKKTPMNMQIGERIKTLRDEAGLNQKEFGDKYHLSQNDVTLIENGYKTVSYELLLDIAKDYNQSTDYFIKENGVRANNPDLQYICDYTGLSEKAIEKLHNKAFNAQNLIKFKKLDIDETYSFADYLNNFVFEDRVFDFGEYEDFLQRYNGDTNKAFEALQAKQKQKKIEEKEKQLLEMLQEYINTANSLICSNYIDEIISSFLSLFETNRTIKALLRIIDNQDVLDNLSEDDLYSLYGYVGMLNVTDEQNLTLFKAQNITLDFLKSQIEFSAEEYLKIYSKTIDIIKKKIEFIEMGEDDE